MTSIRHFSVTADTYDLSLAFLTVFIYQNSIRTSYYVQRIMKNCFSLKIAK